MFSTVRITTLTVAVALAASACGATATKTATPADAPAATTAAPATTAAAPAESADAAGADNMDISDDELDKLAEEIGAAEGEAAAGNDTAGQDVSDKDRAAAATPPHNTRRRYAETNLVKDTIEPSAARKPVIIDRADHGFDTRYPLFGEQPQSQQKERKDGSKGNIGEAKVKDGKLDVSKLPKEYQADTIRTWERIRHILPPEFFNRIISFQALKGDGGASVWNADGLHGKELGWAQTVQTVGNMDHIIIHELGHVFETYPSHDDPNSTYNKFLNMFHPHRNPHIPEGQGKEFYEHFVTGYAATDDGEDFAETFRYFVYVDKPTSSDKVVDQKILLMWEDPAFTKARDHIRKQLGLDK